MRSPTLLLIRMNAAETSASSAIADWTPLDRRAEILDHGRDRHVHHRRVDHQHEHRHRQQDGESRIAGGFVRDTRARGGVHPLSPYHPCRMGYDPASTAAEIGRSATPTVPLHSQGVGTQPHDALNAARSNRVAVADGDRIAKWNANQYTSGCAGPLAMLAERRLHLRRSKVVLALASVARAPVVARMSRALPRSTSWSWQPTAVAELLGYRQACGRRAHRRRWRRYQPAPRRRLRAWVG